MRAMRRLLGLVTCVTIMVVYTASMAASGPSRNRERVVIKEYTAPHGIRTTHWDDQLEMLPERPPLIFEPRAIDRFVKLDLDDVRDDDLFVWIEQNGPGEDLEMAFCGRSGIFRLVSNEPVELRVYSGLCENHLTPLATAGRITATFSPVNWGRGLSGGKHDHH